MSDFYGGLNRWKQHSAQTQLAVKQRLKPLAKVRSVGTLPCWVLIENGQTDGFDRGNMLEANAMDGVASTG